MEVHVTELELFRTCRLSWYYQRREHLVPKKDSQGTPLWIGSGVHHSLAQFYSQKVHPREALLAWDGYQGCSVPLMEEMLDHYFEVFRGDLDIWETLSVETPVRSRIPRTRVWLVGTFDLQVREGGREVWIIDHKTRAYFDNPEDLEANEQITGYLWLAKQLGLGVRGVIWNEIRKASPKSNPRMTEFFRRTRVTRSLRELEQFERDLINTVREMSSKNLTIYPNPSYECSRWSCPYRILCRARRQGGDVELIKEELFATGKP